MSEGAKRSSLRHHAITSQANCVIHIHTQRHTRNCVRCNTIATTWSSSFPVCFYFHEMRKRGRRNVLRWREEMESNLIIFSLYSLPPSLPPSLIIKSKWSTACLDNSLSSLTFFPSLLLVTFFHLPSTIIPVLFYLRLRKEKVKVARVLHESRMYVCRNQVKIFVVWKEIKLGGKREKRTCDTQMWCDVVKRQNHNWIDGLEPGVQTLKHVLLIVSSVFGRKRKNMYEKSEFFPEK